jgi:hypothetical protein
VPEGHQARAGAAGTLGATGATTGGWSRAGAWVLKLGLPVPMAAAPAISAATPRIHQVWRQRPASCIRTSARPRGGVIDWQCSSATQKLNRPWVLRWWNARARADMVRRYHDGRSRKPLFRPDDIPGAHWAFVLEALAFAGQACEEVVSMLAEPLD